MVLRASELCLYTRCRQGLGAKMGQPQRHSMPFNAKCRPHASCKICTEARYLRGLGSISQESPPIIGVWAERSVMPGLTCGGCDEAENFPILRPLRGCDSLLIRTQPGIYVRPGMASLVGTPASPSCLSLSCSCATIRRWRSLWFPSTVQAVEGLQLTMEV